MNTQIGIFKNVDFQEYQSIDAYNFSSIKIAKMKSKKHYLYNVQNFKEMKPTSSMILGSAIHKILLERDLFEKEYKVMSEADVELLVSIKDLLNATDLKNIAKNGEKFIYNKRGGLYQKGKEYFERRGYSVITPIELGVLKSIQHNFNSHKFLRKLVNNCETELTIVWRDPTFGVMMKGRIDMYGLNIIADPKSTDSAGKYNFFRKIRNFRYDAQMAMYYDGMEIVTDKSPRAAMLIAIETKEPNIVQPFLFNPNSVQFSSARKFYKEALQMAIEADEENNISSVSGYVDDNASNPSPELMIECDYTVYEEYELLADYEVNE
jgi:hypothetical protein